MDNITLTKSVRTKLESGRQDAEDSRFLAEICLTAPIDDNTQDYKPTGGDPAHTKELLTDLEMMKLMERLKLSNLTPQVTAIPPRKKA